MCGIVGIIARNAPVPVGALERATQTLAHRGPDDSGTVIVRDSRDEEWKIGLGNRRLAILDLSPLGHQPMNDPKTGNWIVYNGELYNFRDVRAKLEQEGVRFISHCDTEVILQAYGRWGEECLNQFRGMFAFAIWDARRQRLFLARDPIGVKPLYYYQWDRHFIFASEVRTLLETGLVPRKLDRAGLINYLSFGSLYDPNTLVQGVHALKSGCYLTWEQGRVEEVEYYDLISDECVEDFRGSGEARHTSLENQIAEMLDEAVCMQLVSDVPLGVFLSGGIDSSALVAILHRNAVRPSTFSMVFREEDYSEAKYSREVAKRFSTDHHELVVSQSDLFDAIQPAIQAMDLPTIDGINTYFVSQQIRAAGMKVALSGLGGDEIFAGYSSFRTVPLMEKFSAVWRHMPSPLRAVANRLAAVTSFTDKTRKLTALAHSGNGIVHPYFLSRMLFTPEQQQRLLLRSKNEASTVERAEKPLTDCLDRTKKMDPINRVSYLEARCYMLNTLLRDADFMSMACGLEVRVPLIDHRLARNILALPGSWKLDNNMPKPLLVRAMRGQLPEEIIHRPKRGFSLPFEPWLRDTMRPVIEEGLRGIRNSVLRSAINPQGASDVWNAFVAGKTSWSRPWALYVLQRWCEQHALSC